MIYKSEDQSENIGKINVKQTRSKCHFIAVVKIASK